jgi:hypothetical protein
MHANVIDIKKDYRQPEDYLLAYETLVYLNSDFAIVYSAVQNFLADYEKGFQKKLSDWSARFGDYIAEAADNIKNDGFNFYPGYGQGVWIHCRDPFTTPIYYPSIRSQKLLEYFIRLFSRDDPELLLTSLMPDPQIHVTGEAVTELEFHLDAMERFEQN